MKWACVLPTFEAKVNEVGVCSTIRWKQVKQKVVHPRFFG